MPVRVLQRCFVLLDSKPVDRTAIEAQFVNPQEKLVWAH